MGANQDDVQRTREADADRKAELRRRHADRLESMSGLDLEDEEVMAGAWR